MTFTERVVPGKTGAKVMSFDENAARVFVKRVMDDYPQASREEIMRRVRDQVTGKYSKFLPSFIDYATANAWRAIREGEKAAKENSSDGVAAVASVAAYAHVHAPLPLKTDAELEAERHEVAMRRIGQRETAKQDVKLVLLDLLAPNNKLWRDLSVAEYMALGKKQYLHGKLMLSRGHKPAELLATATTEKEIEKAFK